MSKNKKLRIEGDQLCFGDGLRITFQRTLRIPDDGKKYPLPPGLGSFPVRRVDDYADRVPEDWRAHGGVFLPMYQREAMWLLFSSRDARPRAVKIGVGKVCAITGKSWTEKLRKKKQDYVVAPPQPWLDGIATGKGTIRQFVAMPLGQGYTIEGQVTGEERFGGIQIKVFEPRAGIFPERPRGDSLFQGLAGECAAPPPPCAAPPPSCCAAGPLSAVAAPKRRCSRASSMGLAAGGQMTQKIYPDPHGVQTWDGDQSQRVYVHIVNSELWREITGEQPPKSPITAREYANHGLPWFDLYDESFGTVKAQKKLEGIKSVKQLDQHKSSLPLQDDDPVYVGPVKKLIHKIKGGIRDGEW